MPPPSKHPGTARQNWSLNRNARKLSSIYAAGNMKRAGERLQKDCERQGKVLHARIR